jgi:ABC-type Fe3+-hydroxamate transport system substrate-binding protein
VPSRRTLAPVVAVLVAAGLASACGERSEPLSKLAQTYPVTVRGAGDGAVSLDEEPKRIVALDVGSAELLRALGVGKRLVGAPAESVPDVTEVVRRTGQIDIADVAALHPDLLVATPTTDQVDVSRAQRETGAPVYLQPSATIEDVERAALELGFLVGEPVRARHLAARIERQTTAVDSRLAGVRPVKTFVDTGFFIPASDESLLGKLIARAKGVNVGGESGDLGPYNLEDLARADPAVYLATSDSGTTLKKLRKDPATRDLTAVRRHRFVRLETALVASAGPRVAAAYARVAHALHPDAFR